MLIDNNNTGLQISRNYRRDFQLKIFIVEDDELISYEIAEFLTKYQFVCQCVKDFNHIVDEVLASNSDLVLLDINLL